MIIQSIFEPNMTGTAFVICLLTAMVLGLLTALVFQFKSEHSASFALTLAILPMAVTVVIILVNGNIGTGVAVAGAFALVRFRSVPGTAREIAAIFTDVAIGLALGLGFLGIAVIFFAAAALFTLVLTATGFGQKPKAEKQMKITIPENYDYDGLFDDVFERYGVKAKLEKVRTTNMGTLFELSYRITLPESHVPKAFIDELRARNGNLNIVISAAADRELL